MGGSSRRGRHNSLSNEMLQACGKNVRRDTQALLKVSEPRHAGKRGITQDEQTPAFTCDLESARRRAYLPFISFSKHGEIVMQNTCIMQVTGGSVMQVVTS